MPVSHSLRRRTQGWVGLLGLFLITACTAPPQAGSPTSVSVSPSAVVANTATAPAATTEPTTEATAAPTSAAPTLAPTSQATTPASNQATSAPTTAAATAAPAAEDGILPAPVYYIDTNQIWRLEPDGKTRRQITFESERVLGFEIAAKTNSLLYRIGEDENTRVVLLDESGRREMMSGPLGYSTIAPDASRIAVAVEQPIPGLQIGREDSDTGVFIQYRTGGRPGVFVPDAIPTDASEPEFHHLPNVWSPDGSQLVVTKSGFPNKSYLSIHPTNDPSGPNVQINDACCEVTWSSDGKTLLVAGGIDPEFSPRGLWQVDVATGKTTALFADPRSAPLVTLPHLAADGSVLAFIDTVGSLQDPPHLQLARIAGGKATNVSDTVYSFIDGVWAADGSGLVAGSGFAANAPTKLLWVPSDGSKATTLEGSGYNLRLGAVNPTPAPFACDNFSPLAWQPSGERKAQPEVAELQRRLQALGYLPAGSDDSLFGDQTRDALNAFQQANNLPVNGTLDCATWQVLLSGQGKAK